MSEKRALPRLTPRLAAVASQVRPGARLLDVGTDHAYLPAFLVGTGICPAAVSYTHLSGVRFPIDEQTGTAVMDFYVYRAPFTVAGVLHEAFFRCVTMMREIY